MKNSLSLSVIAGIALAGTFAANAAAATCTQTGFFRDSINMTAAVIANGDITGQTIVATGCNIGIYYGPGTSGTVDSSDVSGANYFGIVVSGDIDSASIDGAASVDVTNNTIHDIGESPLNGTQHGVAVYYRAFDAGSSSTGTISGNTISVYQKGGIVANGPGTAVSISGNLVLGQGPVTYIAQNGIQIGYGGTGQIMRNQVTGNSYTGTNNASSAGILIFGGCQDIVGNFPLTTGVQIVKNVIGSNVPADGNDIGVALTNYDATCSTGVATATNNKAINNTIINTELTNISGNGFPIGYQAGISDIGVNDKLIHNDISGAGYQPGVTSPCTPIAPPRETCTVDTSFGSTAAKVHANSFSP
jgi:hypothetical protein